MNLFYLLFIISFLFLVYYLAQGLEPIPQWARQQEVSRQVRMGMAVSAAVFILSALALIQG